MDLESNNGEENGLASVSQCQAIRGPAEAKPKNPVSLELEVLGKRRDGCTSQNNLIGKNRGGAARSRYSAATLKILSSMPSRNIGENTAACICERAKHSAQKCRKQTSSGPTVCSGFNEGENGRMQLVSNLRTLPVGERMCTLKAMPLNLTQKIELRKLTGDVVSNSPVNREPPCYRALYVCVVRTWRLLLSGLAFLSSFRLWRTELKLLGGRFGAPVLSYFLFLRTLLLFNVLLLLVNGLFLAFPQALDPPAHSNSSLHTHRGLLHLLTGEVYVSHSVMFYGYYGNAPTGRSPGWAEPEPTVSSAHDITDQPDGVGGPQAVAPVAYNIPLSYFFTITTGLFVTCIILVCSISRSFGRSFHAFPSRGKLAVTVFCCWDFNVTKTTSVQRQSENISTQLKEQLSERMCCERGHSPVRLLAWAVCLGSVVLSGLATHYLAEHIHVRDQRLVATVEADVLRESHLLVLPAVVSSINMLLPGFFRLVSRVERYDSPLVATYVSVFRNLLLKVSLLGLLCYHWLWRIASEPESYGLQCWETFVGEELYRLILMDFFCTLIHTFTREFLWRLFSNVVLKRGRRPGFDISRHALELIYGQTLTWLGVYFAPLLPIVQLIKLLLLFYIKKSSVTLNCEAPRKPWRATEMTTVFMALLCVPSFLGAVTCVTYTIWTLKPSSACGPFRNATTPLEAPKLLWQTVDAGANPQQFWRNWAFSHLVENPLFLLLAAGVFLIVIYIHAQICDGQKRIIRLLEQQIVNQGYEKRFLVNKLQAIYEEENEDSSSTGGSASLRDL